MAPIGGVRQRILSGVSDPIWPWQFQGSTASFGEGQVEQGAQQPPLKSVEVVRVNADTVRVKLSGRMIVNGGCASSAPLFGIELRTDSGWVECIPFDMTRMDCGMACADWEELVMMLPPLRWWIATHQPEGRKMVMPGRYRLFFVGGDLKRRWSGAFGVE